MNNAQAALYPNERLRVRAEQLRALYGLLLDDVSTFVGELHDYFAPPDGSASPWVDARPDVPHNVTAADVVAFAAVSAAALQVFSPANLALLAKFCVQPLKVG